MLRIPLVIVPRFRSRRSDSRRPINRIKHVVDEQGAIAAAGITDFIITDATDTPTLAATTSVETGSTINSIYLVVEVTRTGTTSDVLPNVYMMLFKNPGNNLTMPNPNVVGANDNKKYVFHQEMVMLQGFNASNPRTLFKGVISIPRHMRRHGPDDTIRMRLLTPGVAISYCVQTHYKEYR